MKTCLKIAALSLAIGPVFMLARVSAADWHSFTSADFPARVTAVGFANGHVLSQSKSVFWGAWTVSFGSNVTATAITPSKMNFIRIDGLTCTNAVAGSTDCSMVITVVDPPAGASFASRCFVANSANNPNFGIACPTDLQLHRLSQ